MSGHSKWSQIKRKKAKADIQRGKVFTKVIKEITIAARMGGGDPKGNAHLRVALENAKAVNMPNDTIKKAIQKGTGELPGVSYEEINYEGYGPGGVAIMAQILTDNKNRTASEIRYVFSKNGGNLGEVGCVSWMFEKKGFIQIDADSIEEDDLMVIVLDAGAQDMKKEGKVYEITTAVEDFENVRKALADKSVEVVSAEISMLPVSTLRVEGKEAHQVLRLIEALEDHDDVQAVYSNFDIPEEIMETLSAA